MTNFYGGGESYIINMIELLKNKYHLVLLISSQQLMKRIGNNIQVIYEPRQKYLSYWKHVISLYRIISRY